MPDQPVRHSRLANWLAGLAGFHDLYKSNAELRRTIEDLRGRLGMADALAEAQRNVLRQADESVNAYRAESNRLADQLEDCNRRLAEVRENGSDRILPTLNE